MNKPPPIQIKDCSISKAAKILGDHWTLLILRESFYGVTRFEDMRQHLNVSRNILTQRLQHLVKNGILERHNYQETGQRRRAEYQLSQKGEDIFPTLIALMQWADKHIPHPKGKPLQLKHKPSGKKISLQLIRQDGQMIQDFHELQAEFWPDAKKNQVQKLQRQKAAT